LRCALSRTCAGGCERGAGRGSGRSRKPVGQRLSGPARFRAVISGRVQMVGFRAFAEMRAQALAVTGYVRNLATGEVEVVAEGDRRLLEELVGALRGVP
jgi:hypothetical protein